MKVSNYDAFLLGYIANLVLFHSMCGILEKKRSTHISLVCRHWLFL